MIETPPLSAPAQALTDGVVTVRPWREEDAEQTAAACSDPEVQRWIPVPSPYTLADAREYIAGREDDRLAGRELGLAVVRAQDEQELLGSIAIVRPSLGDRRVELGYWVAPQARGQGVATRAVGLMSDWVLAEMPVDRLEIIAAVENAASCAVALAAGYRHEAVLARYLIDRAGVHDAAIFALLRD